MEDDLICSVNPGDLIVVKILTKNVKPNTRFIVKVNPDKTLNLLPKPKFNRIDPDYCLVDTHLTSLYQNYKNSRTDKAKKCFSEALKGVEIYSGLSVVFGVNVTAIREAIFK
jgi:hypothetical protein